MDHHVAKDRHFRVVRYYPEFGIGLREDILATNLTLEETETLVRQNPPVVRDESIVIEDVEREGIEAEYHLDDTPKELN